NLSPLYGSLLLSDECGRKLSARTAKAHYLPEETRLCYNSYNSYRRELHEYYPFCSYKHALASRKRTSPQTYGNSPWVDAQRCQCATSGGRTQTLGICVH